MFWGPKFEDSMLERFSKVSRTCENIGMPLMQLAYPRIEGKENYNPEIVSYASRGALETWADVIKTYYTGSKESFETVVKSAGGVPVLLSGGKMGEKPLDFLNT